MDTRDFAERAVQGLLGADAVMPEQFWTSGDATVRLSGEQALMWAVLADGIESYRRYAHATSTLRREEFAEAERWVMSTDWDWPFSFVNLCGVFGLDPGAVREALVRWKHQAARGALRRQRFRPATLRAA